MQMGILTLDQGHVNDSLPYFERAVNWDGNSPPLRYNYAIALSMAGRLPEATRQMEEACRLEPTNPDFRFSLGLAYGELERSRDAATAFQRTIDLNPRHHRAWYNLGQARLKLGDHAGALEANGQAATLDPSNPDYPYAEAFIYQDQGDLPRALEAARRTLERFPRHEAAAHLYRIVEERMAQ